MKNSKKQKSTVTSLRVQITNNFNENIETICELIVFALEESSSAPYLAVDGFLIRAHLKCREMLEFN
jgi:hypothetical protein